MRKWKSFLFVGLAALVLVACDSNDDSDEKETASSVAVSEEVAGDVEESEVIEEPGIQDLDEAVTGELSKIGTDEEVNWDKIHLNKRQFREYIESLSDITAEESESDEESLSIVSSSMTDDNTIDIVISNPDKSEMSSLANGFFALIMDSFTRQLYLSSDFSDGTTHPTIIIKEDSGNVISEATNFIETEETE